MKHMVRDTFHSFGDRGGHVAKTIGSSTAQLARRLGDGTTGLARRVGSRRALIGLAMAAVAIGGTVLLVRYLRARRAGNSVGVLREEASASGFGARTNERVRSPGIAGIESRLSY